MTTAISTCIRAGLVALLLAAGGGRLAQVGAATQPSTPAWFAASIDTMKESMDTDAPQSQLSNARIADTVNAIARLNANYITVDTFWEYPSYTQRWIDAIRATGRHVWFRMHPSQWEDDNGATGIMTPAQYEQGLRAYILAHPSFFEPGDIFDPCPEASNGHYWNARYGGGWGHRAPDAGTAEFNAFLRDTTDIADTALHSLGIYRVITTVHSLNPFWYLDSHALEPATVKKLGLVTIDDYLDQNTTNPATAAGLRLSQLATIERHWHLPILIGEMGYPIPSPRDDGTQVAVLQAEFRAMTSVPYLAGVNYWTAVQASSSILSGSNGNWTVRPAGVALANFFTVQAQAVHLNSGRFTWEDGTTQGWGGTGVVTGLAASTALTVQGHSRSLAVTFTGSGSGSISTGTTLAGLSTGSRLTVRVYVPPAIGQFSLQPYIVDARGTTMSMSPSTPPTGSWETVTFTIPASATPPLQRLGIAFSTSGPGGVWYLDSISDAQ